MKKAATATLLACAAIAAVTWSAAAQYAIPPGQTAADARIRIPYETFKKLYDENRVLVIDIRGADAYRTGHIPGAVVMSIDEIPKRAAELKDEKRPIVTYCS
jgi:3-mercaptopyruvate sulfurtransferase SseA